MSRRADASRANVERILEDGIQDGADRKALREYLLGAEGGRGNTPLHRNTKIIVWRIRELLGVPAELPGVSRARKLKELAAARESGEVSRFDLDLNFLYQLADAGAPLTRKDVDHPTGPQAVVLYPDDLGVIGRFSFMHASGERMTIHPESLRNGDVLILYPRELGNAPPKPPAAEPADVGRLREMAQAMLRTIFTDVAHVTVAEHPEWTGILKAYGMHPALAITQGRQKGVPEQYIHAFAFHECLTRVDKADFAFVARFLKNLKLASDEASGPFEVLAAQAVSARAGIHA